MLVRTSIFAFAIASVLAPQAMAQTAQHFSQDAVPLDAYPSPPDLPIGRGKVSAQSPAQRQVVYRHLPKIEKAVATELGASVAEVELSDLRTGRYKKVMIVCGVAEGVGDRDARRFIARASVATLETPENAAAFQLGWKRTGCGS